MTFLWLLPVSLLLIGLYRWLTYSGEKLPLSIPEDNQKENEV